MDITKKRSARYYINWVLWIILAQLILINLSSALYAYKFTHFYNEPAPVFKAQNIFSKTWKLFTGPKFYKDTSEDEPSFPFEKVKLRTSNNISIDAWYSSVNSAKGCILLFHSITINKSYLMGEAVKFRSFGYNIFMIDFRGHGRSDNNSCSFGVDETDEVQKAFEYAKLRGNEKIILYGLSMGAEVCIKAISENKVRPSGIIADACFYTLHNLLASRAKVLGFPAEPFATLVTMWIGIEKGYNGFNLDVSSYARKLTCPILMGWGAKDLYVNRNDIEKVYRNIPSHNKKLVIYPDADHESYIRIDPLRWEMEVSLFLNSLPG